MKPKRLSLIGVTLTLAAGVAVASAQTVPVPTPVARPVASAPTGSTTPTSTTMTSTPTSAKTRTTASTSSTTTTPPASAGAFDTLSTGNQKIARALYDAQATGTTTGSGSSPTGTGTATGTGTKSLTLDEIAAMKQSGRGWGQVFKDMKSQGLVQEKNLGQVVSRSHRHQPITRTEVTTAGNRTVDRGPARRVSIDGDGDDVSKHGRGTSHVRTDTTSVRGHTWTTGGNGHAAAAASSGGGHGRSASAGHAGGRGK